MNPSLSAVLFCLVICAVFVWLAVKRMRADKPYRVFVWLARFFGVMVVMGVFNILEAEGNRLGGLVVVAGAFAVLAIVSWVVRRLGARKKADLDSMLKNHHACQTKIVVPEQVAREFKPRSLNTWALSISLITLFFLVGRYIFIVIKYLPYSLFKECWIDDVHLHLSVVGFSFLVSGLIYIAIRYVFSFVLDSFSKASIAYKNDNPLNAICYAFISTFSLAITLCLIIYAVSETCYLMKCYL